MSDAVRHSHLAVKFQTTDLKGDQVLGIAGEALAPYGSEAQNLTSSFRPPGGPTPSRGFFLFKRAFPFFGWPLVQVGDAEQGDRCIQAIGDCIATQNLGDAMTDGLMIRCGAIGPRVSVKKPNLLVSCLL